MKIRVMCIVLFCVFMAGIIAPACNSGSSFEVTSLTVTPYEVAPGEEVKVSAIVLNTGKNEGIYTATLMVQEEIVETRQIPLASGSEKTIRFNLVKNEIGTYNVRLDDLKAVMRVVEPAAFEVTSLEITPDEVGLRQEAIVTAVVRNTGQASGVYSTCLTVDGSEFETKDITVPGGTECNVRFNISKYEAGDYKIGLGDENATLTVREGFYRNTLYGFSAEFPESWRYNESGGQSPVVVFNSPDNKAKESIYIGYAETPLSSKEQSDIVFKSLQEEISDLELLSENEITLADSSQAHEIVLAYTTKGTDAITRIISIMRGTQCFTRLLTTTKTYYNSKNLELNEFSSLFQLEEPRPFGVPLSESLVLFDTGPFTLDPAKIQSVVSAAYAVEIFGGLVTFNQNMEIVPDIAERWDVSDDGKTYTFYLRKGVKFHNRKEVVASDFKYSMERACNPATGSENAETYLGDIVGADEVLSGKAKYISGIKVIDDYTLEITMDVLKPYFLSKLTHHTASVIDRVNVESDEEWWRHPNGTGPFKLREWQEEELLILERNDLYHLEPARVSYIVYRLWGGRPVQMYETGEIDVTEVSPYTIEKALDPANPLNKELRTVTRFSLMYIQFNHTKPPFDDINIRKAFCHSIDKDRIINVVLKDMKEYADGILPPGFPGYDESIIGLSYNPQKAKDLIAQSDYKNVSNLPTITLTSSGRGEASPLETALIDMWRQNLGVEVRLKQLEPESYSKVIMEEKDEIFYNGWGADYPDPQNFLDVLFHSGSEQNTGEYSNTEVDKLLEQARIEQDVTARMKLYHDIEQMLIDDAACLPLYFDKEYYLVKPYVKNLVFCPMLVPTLRYVSVERNW